jgi:hypothetical protein
MQHRIDIASPQPFKTVSLGFLAYFGVLGVFLPALAIATTDGRWSVALAMAICVTVYAGFRLSSLSFYSPRSVLQLTFWMFVYCWLGLAASVQLKANHFPWPTATDADDYLWSDAVIILGIAAYEAGVHFGRKPTAARFAAFTLDRPSRGRFAVLAIGCVAISSWAIYRQGGVSNVLRTRYETGRAGRWSASAQSERLTYQALQRVPPVVALLVSLYLFTEKSSSKRERRSVAIAATALGCFNLVANYPPSLARLFLGFVVVSIAVLVLRKRAKLVPLFVLCMILGMIVLFPYADYFRTGSGYTVSDLSAPTDKLIYKADYDAFQMVANTVKVVKARGVAFGYNFLGACFFYVPRAVCPAKPYGTGKVVGEVVGYSRSSLNLSSPLWAEFYYAGGTLLVIVGFWVYGYMTRRAEGRELWSPISAVAVAYAAGAQIFVLRGDLLNSVAYFAPGALLLLMFVGRPIWFRSVVERSTRIASSKCGRLQPGLLAQKH